MKRYIIFDYTIKVLFILFFVFNCSVILYAGVLNKGNEILDLRFSLLESGPTIQGGHVVKGKNNLFYVTLPQTVGSDKVAIEILSSVHSSVRINGAPALTKNQGIYNDQEAEISYGSVDIQNTVSIDVVSEVGLTNSYDVIIKKGIWELDSLIYDFKEKYNIPGVSFAIANLSKTETVYSAGYGYAIRENKTKVRPDHLFRLASMSKQHTAIAILKLVEEGKFSINDTVFGPSGILKEQFPVVPARAAKITVRNLLEHTSGFRSRPDYMFDSPYSGWSMKQRIEAMLKSPQVNEPGAVFAYYNTGYGVLGYIIETVSGKTYEQYIKEMYATIGINDIYVGGTQSERRWNEVAYYGQNNANADGKDMDVRASAGGLITSTEQLIKLLWALDGKPNIPDILKPETRQMMFTPSTTGRSRYALGWRTNHAYFPDSFYHGGTLAGVATFWVFSEGYAVVFLCNSRSNSSRFDDDLYKMARDIISDARFKGL